jgi:hypothetical protein
MKYGERNGAGTAVPPILLYLLPVVIRRIAGTVSPKMAYPQNALSHPNPHNKVTVRNENLAMRVGSVGTVTSCRVEGRVSIAEMRNKCFLPSTQFSSVL